DRERSDFLARVTHDFRAPLTAATGYCGLLLAQELGPLTDMQAEVLSRTQQSLRRLERMTAGFFDLAVGPRTSRVPHLAAGELHECAKQAVHETQSLADERRLKISVDLAPSPRTLC